jgi:hypothetical protein
VSKAGEGSSMADNGKCRDDGRETASTKAGVMERA